MVVSPRPVRIGQRLFEWGARTYVMGVVNATPDSFSGDGVLGQAAIERALAMEEEGADLVDIGGESTRPQTWSRPPLPAAEELARILPILESLQGRLRIPISVDTSKADVAAAALEAGASLVNDVWGLQRDPAMAATVAAAGVPVVVMHNKPGGGYQDLLKEIAAGLKHSLARARTAGIPDEHVICDPGIGFGKTRDENLEIIRRLKELRELGRPLLVGPSRKSFIGLTLDLPVDDRLEGTAAAVALCVAGGADLVRVHDVRAMARVVRLADAVVRGGSP